MITSLPAGRVVCDACGREDSPTLSVWDAEGMITACDRCREPFEAKGATSARSIELAISKTAAGKVAARDAMIRNLREATGQNKRDKAGNHLLMDIGLGEVAEAKRRERRNAA
jgi:ribosome-binding protein aMBF1 (putative translation factor)